MRHLKSFDEFVAEGIIIKVAIDKERAKALTLESERKSSSLIENVKKIGVKDENANDYVEYCYDIKKPLSLPRLKSRGLF